LKLRRRRWLIAAQGSSAARTLGTHKKRLANPERVYCEANPFRVTSEIEMMIPGLSRRSNPGLELANAFGVNTGLELRNAFGVNAALKLQNALA